MSLMSYEYVSVEKDSRGEMTITIHLSAENGSGHPTDNRDDHQLYLSREEWRVMANAVDAMI